MKRLSIKQLKIIRNLICVAGIAGGFALWTLLTDTHQSEIHTEDPEERTRLEEERVRKEATRQVFTARDPFCLLRSGNSS